jgi:catechol 2,3-dioxygenase-like lactoylglutathione lyase family enzyme
MLENAGVKCVDHVTVVVHDLEATHNFYVGFLGMQSVPRPNFSFEGAWFQAGATLVHVIMEHHQSGPAGRAPIIPYAPGRTWHFAFLVDDGPAAYEVALKQNIPISVPPKTRPDGAYQFFVLDPDGHVVELAQLPTN